MTNGYQINGISFLVDFLYPAYPAYRVVSNFSSSIIFTTRMANKAITAIIFFGMGWSSACGNATKITAAYIGCRMSRYGPFEVNFPDDLGWGWTERLAGGMAITAQIPAIMPVKNMALPAKENGSVGGKPNNTPRHKNCPVTSIHPIVAWFIVFWWFILLKKRRNNNCPLKRLFNWAIELN